MLKILLENGQRPVAIGNLYQWSIYSNRTITIPNAIEVIVPTVCNTLEQNICIVWWFIKIILI